MGIKCCCTREAIAYVPDAAIGFELNSFEVIDDEYLGGYHSLIRVELATFMCAEFQTNVFDKNYFDDLYEESKKADGCGINRFGFGVQNTKKQPKLQ